MKKNYLAIFILCFSFFGCNFQSVEDTTKNNKQSVSFVTWNTQTFFDGITDGTEYSEFQKTKNWNNNKYLTRLNRLCEVIEALDADIFVLQEIENQAVMQDISNMMAGNSWNKQKIWPYVCFVKEDNASIGCGVFSKYPISNIKSHSLDIRSEKTAQPSLRPLLEASITVNDKTLSIFINHWKSKSGGAESSQIWRNWQETELCNCLNKITKNQSCNCIAAGDFNQDIKEFNCNTTYNTQSECSNNSNIIFKSFIRNCNNISVYSPWLKENGEFSTNIGSYFYKDKWERIDNIFAVGNISITDFAPKAEEPWTDTNGIPIKYTYYDGQGYSDHLPLMCTLTF